MPTAQINGVIHQIQLNPRACWYTCLQMGVRYYENQAQASLANLRSPDTFPDMQQRFADGSNPSWAEWRSWTEQCGFTPLNLSANADGIYQFLSIYGPIIYSGTWGNTFDGHVVILTGINSDTGALYVDDALEVSAPVTNLSWITGSCFESSSLSVSPAAASPSCSHRSAFSRPCACETAVFP